MADSACPTVRFFFSTQKSNRASDETAERQRGRQGRASIPGFEFKNARTVGHAKSPPDHFLVKVCWQIFTFRRATLGTNFDDTRTQGAETTNESLLLTLAQLSRGEATSSDEKGQPRLTHARHEQPDFIRGFEPSLLLPRYLGQIRIVELGMLQIWSLDLEFTRKEVTKEGADLEYTIQWKLLSAVPNPQEENPPATSYFESEFGPNAMVKQEVFAQETGAGSYHVDTGSVSMTGKTIKQPSAFGFPEEFDHDELGEFASPGAYRLLVSQDGSALNGCFFDLDWKEAVREPGWFRSVAY